MKVRFLPQDITCEIKPNQSVLEVAQENNIFVKSVCGGVPSCAECRVRVIDGEYNVLPPSHNELSLIGTAHFVDRRRLSCQLRCFGDITVDLNEQVAKQQTQGKVKTRAGQREESIESHAVKGSILAESRSMLGPQTSSSGPSVAPEARGALDREPKGPRPPSAPRENRPPQQQQARQQQRPPAQRPPQAAPINGEPGQNLAQAGAPGEKREGGARRRRGGRGRNKNRSGGGGPSGGSGTPSNSGGSGGPGGGN